MAPIRTVMLALGLGAASCIGSVVTFPAAAGASRPDPSVAAGPVAEPGQPAPATGDVGPGSDEPGSGESGAGQPEVPATSGDGSGDASGDASGEGGSADGSSAGDVVDGSAADGSPAGGSSAGSSTAADEAGSGATPVGSETGGTDSGGKALCPEGDPTRDRSGDGRIDRDDCAPRTSSAVLTRAQVPVCPEGNPTSDRSGDGQINSDDCAPRTSSTVLTRDDTGVQGVLLERAAPAPAPNRARAAASSDPAGPRSLAATGSTLSKALLGLALIALGSLLVRASRPNDKRTGAW